MTSAPTINTHRLHLRGWRPEDFPHFAAMNADPRVVELLLAFWTVTRATPGRLGSSTTSLVTVSGSGRSRSPG